MATATNPRKAEKVETLAAEIDVSADTVIGWIRGGKLPYFLAPGKETGSKRPGPRLYRVFRDDWDRFLVARRHVDRPAGGEDAAPAPAPASAPARGVAVGPDGVSRRRRGRGA